MEEQAGSRLPSHFLSIPDAVFPMYHVFADVAAFKGAEVIRTESSDPMRVECMAMIQPSGLRALAANLSARQVSVHLRLDGIATSAEMRVMDEDNIECFMTHPEARRQEGVEQLVAQDGVIRFGLKPYAIATIDALRAPSQSAANTFHAGGRP